MKATLFGTTWLTCMMAFGIAAEGRMAGALAFVGFVLLIWVLALGVQLASATDARSAQARRSAELEVTLLRYQSRFGRLPEEAA